MKPTKKTRQLPGRGGLNDLGKSQRTIVDYSKASPITEATPQPAAILKLAQRGRLR
jgi:hypothetical protein